MLGTGLDALAARLSKTGLFVNQCIDDNFPPERGWTAGHPAGLFHPSQALFEEHGWTIWDTESATDRAGGLAHLMRFHEARPQRWWAEHWMK